MDIKKVIDYKVNLLIDIMLTDGVSPSDLANNIFTEEYTDISFHKDGDFIYAEISFYDIEKTENVKMKYLYNKLMRVQRIEEFSCSKWSLLWDRNMREQELANEIIEFMKLCYNATQINEFVNTLPDNVRCKVQNELMKSA